jgi:hypothetical protein
MVQTEFANLDLEEPGYQFSRIFGSAEPMQEVAHTLSGDPAEAKGYS